ncbi:MAG: BatA domain-containing protein [Methanocellales archaeon]
MQFENSLFLIALASLIPVIILYLIKPKPREIKIPSLMFIMYTEKKEKKYHSILRKLIAEPLLLIQLFALAALSIALAGPYIYAAAAGFDHTVIVLDASASMQAKDVKPSRFAQAIDLAKQYTQGRVSIILAMNTPVLIFERGGARDANLVLDQLQPSATSANLGDAILLAKGLIGKERGRIVVISDFAGWEGLSPLIAEKIIASKNIEVEYVQVASDTNPKNVGIISTKFKDSELSFVVKNFAAEEKRVTIYVYLNDRFQSSDKRIIPAYSSDFFTLTNITQKGGVLKINLEVEGEDDLPIDNILYISIPQVKNRRVLVISENITSPLHIAISVLPNTKLINATPPVLPKFDQDLVVLSNVKQNSLLPGTLADLKSYVEGGGNLVVLATQDLPKLGINELLPVEIIGLSNNSSSIVVDLENEFSRDIDFGWVNNYFNARAKNNSIVIASALRDGTPIVAYWVKGLGRVIYLGTNCAFGDVISGDFYLKTNYPVFWLQLIDWVSATPNLMDFNFKTGEILPFSSEQIVTFESQAGAKTIETKNLLLNEVGIYSIGDRKISANLLDEHESNLSPSEFSSEAAALLKKTELSGEKQIEKLNLKPYVLCFVLALVILELIYLKHRGEL